MDKKNSVSIRLNGKEQKFVESNKMHRNSQELSNVRDEIAAASESIPHDIHVFGKNGEDRDLPFEKEKKVVDLGSKRQEKEENTGPFWDDGKREKSPKLPPHKRKKKRNSKLSFDFLFHSVFLAVVAAVIVGGAFGTLLLSLFTNGETVSTEIQSENGQPAITTPDTPVVLWDDDETELVPPPTMNFQVVQAGAFSTVEKGTEEAASFHQKGLPGVIHQNPDLQYLFIGIHREKEELEKLTEVYEDEWDITDKYLKQFIVEANGEGVPEAWAKFMEHGVNWMEQAADVSVVGLSGASLGEEQVNGMLEAAESWEKALNELDGGEDNPLFEKAEQWVDSGENIIQLFNSPPLSKGDLWEIQQGVLQAMIIYDDLVDLINRQESQ